MYRKNHIIEFKTIDYSRLFISLPVFNECTFSPRYCLLQNAGHFARIFFMKKKNYVKKSCSALWWLITVQISSIVHLFGIRSIMLVTCLFIHSKKRKKKSKWKRDIYCTVVLKGLHLNSPLFYYVLVVESLDFVLYFCFCCNHF